MRKARLVITAVVVEGRKPTEVDPEPDAGRWQTAGAAIYHRLILLGVELLPIHQVTGC